MRYTNRRLLYLLYLLETVYGRRDLRQIND